MSRCPAGCQWGLDEQILVGGLLGGLSELARAVRERVSFRAANDCTPVDLPSAAAVSLAAGAWLHVSVPSLLIGARG